MIKKSLIISAINLFCNIPSHALRTIWTLDSSSIIPDKYKILFEGDYQFLTM